MGAATLADLVFLSNTEKGLARGVWSAPQEFTIENLLSGVEVRCLAVDPLNRNRVYAGTQGAGVLRSDDCGRNWQAVGLLRQTVMAVAPSPVQPGVIYAGGRPAGLYVSADGGASWDELPAFRRILGSRFWFSPAGKPFTAYVQAIALSPVDPQTVVVGVEFGATLLSCDGGQSWSGHRRGALRDCHGLYFHPVDGSWVYEAGGTGGGAAFSQDGGRTWTKAGQGMDRHYGWAVAADPVDPALWYVSVSPGPSQAHSANNAQAYIFRREGSHWRRLAGGLPQPLAHMPYSLITGPVAGSLYIGLSNGDIWHSVDYGESWRRLPVKLGSIHRSLVIWGGAGQ